MGLLGIFASIRDNIVDDEKLSVRSSSSTKLCEELDAILVGPVVGDSANDEDGSVLDRLRGEDIVGYRGLC